MYLPSFTFNNDGIGRHVMVCFILNSSFMKYLFFDTSLCVDIALVSFLKTSFNV